MGKLGTIYMGVALIVFTICIYHVLTNSSATSEWYDESILVLFSILGIGFILHIINISRGKRDAVLALILNVIIIICLVVFLNTTDGAGHTLSVIFLWALCVFYVVVSFFVFIGGLLRIHKWSKNE